MKVKMQEPRTRPFEPVEITITIESREELADLWYRLNVASAKINGKHDRDGLPSDWRASCDGSSRLWSKLNDVARERGYLD